MSTSSPSEQLTPIVLDADFAVASPGAIEIKSSRPLVLRGELSCPVTSAGPVIIAPGGLVSGPLSCSNLIVAGAVTSPEIQVSGLMLLLSTADVRSELVRYGDIEKRRGARLTGRLEYVSGDSQVAAEFLSAEQEANLISLAGGDSQATAVAEPVAVAAAPIPSPAEPVTPVAPPAVIYGGFPHPGKSAAGLQARDDEEEALRPQITIDVVATEVADPTSVLDAGNPPAAEPSPSYPQSAPAPQASVDTVEDDGPVLGFNIGRG